MKHREWGVGIQGHEPGGLRGNELTVIVHYKDQQEEKDTSAMTWKNPCAGSQHTPASLHPQGLHQTCSFLNNIQRHVCSVSAQGSPWQTPFRGFIENWSCRHNNQRQVLKFQAPKGNQVFSAPGEQDSLTEIREQSRNWGLWCSDRSSSRAGPLKGERCQPQVHYVNEHCLALELCTHQCCCVMSLMVQKKK